LFRARPHPDGLSPSSRNNARLTSSLTNAANVEKGSIMQEHKDSALEKIIEQGVALQATKGTATAWVFLTYHQVPRSVVASVLAKAAQSNSRNI
jgi:hypothetical protein